METYTEQTNKTIDATGMRLGRLATTVASLLQGKDLANFARNTIPKRKVMITNAKKLDVPESKKSDEYQRYSGHPGGRKVETLEHLGKRRGYAEVIRRTVSGMLPKNKLHKPMMHNLEITE